MVFDLLYAVCNEDVEFLGIIILESVQKYSSVISYLSSRCSITLIFTANSAAVNSSLGIVTILEGATLALPIINAQNTSSPSIKRKYEHVPYPVVLASEKWCNS